MYCVNTSFDVLEVHLQWDDHWMIVVTAFQTIPWVFTWETWITLPVSSHIVQFLDAHDSFNYSFLKNKKIKRKWDRKAGEFKIQNHTERRKMKSHNYIRHLQKLKHIRLCCRELKRNSQPVRNKKIRENTCQRKTITRIRQYLRGSAICLRLWSCRDFTMIMNFSRM